MDVNQSESPIPELTTFKLQKKLKIFYKYIWLIYQQEQHQAENEFYSKILLPSK